MVLLHQYGWPHRNSQFSLQLNTWLIEPGNTIWQYKSGSKLIQAWLVAASYYQCYLYYNQWGFVAFPWDKVNRACWRSQSITWVWKLHKFSSPINIFYSIYLMVCSNQWRAYFTGESIRSWKYQFKLKTNKTPKPCIINLCIMESAGHQKIRSHHYKQAMVSQLHFAEKWAVIRWFNCANL